eukprot:1158357-Pelagomonas_calceolata.AAC.1
MRIGRVVGHAPRRPDSPSPCIHLRAPSDPSPPKSPQLHCSPDGVQICMRTLKISSLLTNTFGEAPVMGLEPLGLPVQRAKFGSTDSKVGNVSLPLSNRCA